MQQWALAAAAIACACLSTLRLSEAAASEYITDTEHFPGWKGALPAVDHAGIGAEDRHSQMLSVGALGKVRTPRCAVCNTVTFSWIDVPNTRIDLTPSCRLEGAANMVPARACCDANHSEVETKASAYDAARSPALVGMTSSVMPSGPLPSALAAKRTELS